MTQRILVVGATGLLGNAVFRVLSENRDLEVSGTVRNRDAGRHFTAELAQRLIGIGSLESPDELVRLIDSCDPQIVVNCAAVGRPAPADPMRSVAIYSVLPQRLAHLCRARGTRLVQIGSDGVFTGRRGNYAESDLPDAEDVYGVAKLLGEVDGPGITTLRTSIIGPELERGRGLLEWFLAQQGSCQCYTRAIFSGLPTVELAKMIRDVILPRNDLRGLFHVAAQSVSKYDLLRLIAEGYRKEITIVPDDSVVIDRSLSAERLKVSTGYTPPA